MRYIDTGFVSFKVRSAPKSVLSNIDVLYPEVELDFADFTIELKQEALLRRLFKPQISFYHGNHTAFRPLPLSQAYPFLEWGMNWCVAAHMFNYLIIHAAVLEKDGKAIIFPAPPGSGKSTLTAYMMFNGWRLLSDEMAVIDMQKLEVRPSVRPICLKNDSIGLIKKLFPQTVSTGIARDTQKGDVAHVKPTSESFERRHETAKIVGVVFPKYTGAEGVDIYQLSKADVLMSLKENSFNFDTIGVEAFECLKKVVEMSACFEVEYGDTNDFIRFLESDVL
ncbi:HprK-related kinase A [Alteromonadaceae bacterium M269]|nr:HprK-related kinase A [Alteromonadaceae bacterium M269]